MKRLYRCLTVLSLLSISMVGLAQQTTPLPVPSGLKATVVPGGWYSSVKITWKGQNGPWAYKVYRAVDSVGNFKVLNLTDMTMYQDYQVTNGHKYFYAVSSVTMHGSVTVESALSNIDSVSLTSVQTRPVGFIAGTVIDSVTGSPISNVRVLFYRPLTPMPMPLPMPTAIIGMLPSVWTDSLGQYKATLDTGVYIIKAQPCLASNNMTRYVPEWYRDAKTADKATPVHVSSNAVDTADFDLKEFVLPVALKLSGTVRDSAGNPLAKASVVVVRSVQSMELDAAAGASTSASMVGATMDGMGYVRGISWAGLTDTLGHYTATVYSNGSYIVGAVKKFYVPQFYDHVASPDLATVLTPTSDTTGIDFNLSLVPAVNNSVAGTVQDSAGTSVPSRIALIPVRGQTVPLAIRFSNTDSTGSFSISSVRAGKYLALAIPYSGYAPAFYKAGAFGVMHWAEADTITVSGNVTGINIGVVAGQFNGVATLHGILKTTKPLAKTDATSGLPGANVYLQSSTGSIVSFATTDQNGSYSLPGVPAGNYALLTEKAGYASPSNSVSVSSLQYTATVSDITIDPVVATAVSELHSVPTGFVLGQNYPNPFNPTTVIQYSLPAQGMVSMVLYNVLGQEVATLASGVQTAGVHQVIVDGKGLASGVYFYRLSTGANTETRRMVLLK